MDISDITKVASRKRISEDAEKLREKVSRETAKIIKLKVAQDTAYWDLKEKLQQVEANHERLQQNMVEVQMQHEATSGQYQDELRLRPETLNKVQGARRVCSVLEEAAARARAAGARAAADRSALCGALRHGGLRVRGLRDELQRGLLRLRERGDGLRDQRECGAGGAGGGGGRAALTARRVPGRGAGGGGGPGRAHRPPCAGTGGGRGRGAGPRSPPAVCRDGGRAGAGGRTALTARRVPGRGAGGGGGPGRAHRPPCAVAASEARARRALQAAQEERGRAERRAEEARAREDAERTLLRCKLQQKEDFVENLQKEIERLQQELRDRIVEADNTIENLKLGLQRSDDARAALQRSLALSEQQGAELRDQHQRLLLQLQVTRSGSRRASTRFKRYVVYYLFVNTIYPGRACFPRGIIACCRRAQGTKRLSAANPRAAERSPGRRQRAGGAADGARRRAGGREGGRGVQPARRAQCAAGPPRRRAGPVPVVQGGERGARGGGGRQRGGAHAGRAGRGRAPTQAGGRAGRRARPGRPAGASACGQRRRTQQTDVYYSGYEERKGAAPGENPEHAEHHRQRAEGAVGPRGGAGRRAGGGAAAGRAPPPPRPRALQLPERHQPGRRRAGHERGAPPVRGAVRRSASRRRPACAPPRPATCVPSVARVLVASEARLENET
uniref:Uncharacterized protein n=1 Tax=Bombyx mori TaxID=7091 RepID=A0A8R2M6B6_BOMMO|nr:uncharacterized protein LOC110386614 isoform X1 [Bombyx mori]